MLGWRLGYARLIFTSAIGGRPKMPCHHVIPLVLRSLTCSVPLCAFESSPFIVSCSISRDYSCTLKGKTQEKMSLFYLVWARSQITYTKSSLILLSHVQLADQLVKRAFELYCYHGFILSVDYQGMCYNNSLSQSMLNGCFEPHRMLWDFGTGIKICCYQRNFQLKRMAESSHLKYPATHNCRSHFQVWKDILHEATCLNHCTIVLHNKDLDFQCCSFQVVQTFTRTGINISFSNDEITKKPSLFNGMSNYRTWFFCFEHLLVMIGT